METQRAGLLISILVSVAIYVLSGLLLKQPFEFALIGMLLLSALVYTRFQENRPISEQPGQTTAMILLLYALGYFIAMYPFHVLGMSIVYPFTHVLIPWLVLRYRGEKTSAIQFRWRDMFKGFGALSAVALVLLPYLAFTVRDSAQIIALMKTPKGWLYLPLGVLYMLVVVACWEEFLFRGVIQSSLEKTLKSPSLSILISACAFSAYHVPMKYYNPKSPFFNDLWASVAGSFHEQFIMGLFLGYCVYRSRNLWHGIWLHAMFNGISFVYKLSLMLH